MTIVIQALADLSPPERAAAMLLALGDQYATAILSKLEDFEVRELSERMSSLGILRAEVIEELYVEFAGKITSTGEVMGSFSTTERLLLSAFDKHKAAQIMEEIRGPAGRTMWDKLSNVDETTLSAYLQNEYPQTVAVILSMIETGHSARILSILPQEFSLDVMKRMLKIDIVQRDVLEDVEKTLRTEFMSNLVRSNQRDPHQTVAAIFNAFDRQTETQYMTLLEESEPENAEQIKMLMFTFEDLIKLDGPSIQKTLRVSDKNKVALALKGASAALKNLFFSNMSERAGRLMKEDMEAMGMVKISDVDIAQSDIVSHVKELLDQGEVTLSGDDDEEMVG